MGRGDSAGSADLVVRARQAVVGGQLRPVAVAVRHGRIETIDAYDDAPTAAERVDLADDEVLLPGLVDSHVHVNEPGRTEWEGFACATRAAAAGGVTTIVDMPLNSIPATTSVEALRIKQQVARSNCHVDVAFWGGIVPGNLDDLQPMHDAGVMGFKAFLVPSGVDEFRHVTYAELEAALAVLAPLGALVVVHAEDPDVIASAPPPSGRHYASFLASRPAAAEDTAVTHLAELAARTGARLHVLHLASANALATVRRAQAAGLDLTAETCPHYLTLAADEVPDGATTFKCCPPVRTGSNREALWAGLREGALSMVVSDHSPCPEDLKVLDTGDFALAWGGVSSLQLGLPLVWSGARRRGFDLTDVVRWMAEAPAARVGLARKGRIAVGSDADLVAFSPDQTLVVDAKALAHRNPVTPYQGRELSGVVRRTWLRGLETTGPATGQLLERSATPPPLTIK